MRFLYVLPVVLTGFAVGRTAGLAAALLALVTSEYVFVLPVFGLGAGSDSLPRIALFAIVLIGAALAGGYVRDAERNRQVLYDAERARARQQQTVAAIGHVALTQDDPAIVMERAVALAAQALGVEYAKVLELLPDRTALMLRAGHGFGPELVGTALVPAGPMSQAGYTLHSGGPVIVEDLRTEARFPGASLLHDHGVVSGISVAVQGAGRPYGIFGIHTQRRRTFTQDDVYFVQAMANVLGAALQRREAELALRETNERLRVAIEAGRFGTWQWDVTGGRIVWSSTLEAIHGMPPGAFGGTFEDFQRDIHPDDRTRVLEAVRRAAEGPGGYETEYRILWPDGSVHWVLARGIVLRSPQGRPVRMLGVCGDVTARKAAEQEREALLAQERQARADAEAARERLAFLAEASSALVSTLDYEETLSNVAALAVRRLADWCAVDLLREDGSLELVAIGHADPGKMTAVTGLHRTIPRDSRAAWGPQHVVRMGGSESYPLIPGTRGLETVPAEIRQAFPGLPSQAAMIVPLVAHGRTLGAITFAIGETGRRFGESDLQLAQELARRVALFVDNARLYHREHRIAVTLQQALLPAGMPEAVGLRLDAAYQPALADAEVGGDWYDAFRLQDGRIVLSIGDVAGHGLQAAVAMGLVRQAIRAAAYEGEQPANMRCRAGRLLHLSDATAMATALVGILDPATRLFIHASAGHPPALLVTQDGEVVKLVGGGLPLGTLLQPARTQVHVTELPLGALLVLYTDGLIEMNRKPLDGEARLEEVLRQVVRAPSLRPAQAVLDRMLAGQSGPDDVAILTIATDHAAPEEIDFRFPAIPSALPLIRQGVWQILRGTDLDPARVAALQVAVGEAANNVIEHAYGLSPGEIQIHAVRSPQRVAVEVRDTGRWRRPRADGGGRGLAIMLGLVDEVEIDSGNDGTTVRLAVRSAGQVEEVRA
jgi:PAS domain S-box-containing protein